MTSGLYTGRFQPFHLGHISAIRQALLQVDKLYIAIGSAQYDYEERNPFTVEERQNMITLALEEAGLADRCKIFRVPDIHDNEKWTTHVRNIVPPFEKVFVGNEGLVKELFEKEGLTQIIDVQHEILVSATKIRKAIRENDEWKNMLPPKVADYLENIDGPGRIMRI